ncbi:hypothetical protein RST01_22710 [Rummeliibacillus stabekisii]|nr:hypothetical protein RST01_22710 [Rummeliibacillus stabekisii]
MNKFTYKKEGESMYKYLVEIRMTEGQSLKLRTNSDVREINPVKIDDNNGYSTITSKITLDGLNKTKKYARVYQEFKWKN